MKKLVYLLLISILILFIGCKNSMKNGTIIKKWYEPDNTQILYIPFVVTDGKYTKTILIPYLIYDKEDFCIKVRGVNYVGDTITKTFFINKSSYDTLNVGDYIHVDDYCDADKNNTKIEKK